MNLDVKVDKEYIAQSRETLRSAGNKMFLLDTGGTFHIYEKEFNQNNKVLI